MNALPTYLDPDAPIEARVDDLLARMTLAEKIGQMTQVEKNSITLDDIADLFIGSLLSGGGGAPDDNSPAGWATMVDEFQSYALTTRLGIPLIYGVDAIHGHNNLYGATIFPHQIGLGASRDPALVEQIGQATAAEMAATGIRWNFAPVVAVPHDIRWGRVYEGYAEDTELVSQLAVAYLTGLQHGPGLEGLRDPLAALATPKHYLGDGATEWGSSTTGDYMLDQGDMRVDEATVRATYLPPYKAAVDAGALSIMVSFSSWNGTKLHAQKYLLTDVLKGELGFSGFLVSDWGAVDQIPGGYDQAVATSINAGLDMIMVPYDYQRFIRSLTGAVDSGKVPNERIDDAVRRILTVKFRLGLFEAPMSDPAYLELAGAAEHRELARKAVAESLVLLKNQHSLLPLAKDVPVIFVAGTAADDIGMMCGGWTISWQGDSGDIQPGTTILSGIRAAVGAGTRVEYNRFGRFEDLKDDAGNPLRASVGIAVVGETPYAEGEGDRENITLSAREAQWIDRVRASSDKLVVILVSGRPLVVTEYLPGWDALVAAWLPGTEGQGVADGLFGEVPFTGRLPYTWPRWNAQLPFTPETRQAEGCDGPLFPYGYGLGDAGSQPLPWLECPAP